MNCPSKFCNHDNPEESSYCGTCGLNLKLSQQLILAWDVLYSSFRKMLKEEFKTSKKDFELDLASFRIIMKEHPEYAFVVGFDQGLKSKTSSKKDEAPLIKLEKEKIKVLKEIRDVMKENKIIKKKK